MPKFNDVVSTAFALFLAAGAGQAWAKQVPGSEQGKMQREIEGKLRKDADLKNNRIDVSVDNSVATLKGTVDTQAERTRAESLAHVDGVVRVDDQLEVGSAGIGAALTDTALTTKVKADLVGDDALKHSDISVTTNNGVVILTGTVPSENARQHATTVAQSASGVKQVSNKLRVVPEAKP